jgi:hypothetical protein
VGGYQHVSEKHAASNFRFEEYRLRNRYGYIGKLQGRRSWDPGRGEVNKETWSKQEDINE